MRDAHLRCGLYQVDGITDVGKNPNRSAETEWLSVCALAGAPSRRSPVSPVVQYVVVQHPRYKAPRQLQRTAMVELGTLRIELRVLDFEAL